MYGIVGNTEMKAYYAEGTGKKGADSIGVFLSTTEQMDRYLKKGYTIYEYENEERKGAIATPEEGYLVEKPILPERVYNVKR